MKYFNNVNNLEDLKAQYRRLAIKNHPDHGGSTEVMQAINAEYEQLFKVLKDRHNAEADEQHQTSEAPEEFIDIINALIKLTGLTVELCGSWLWIGGNTREHKEELKACGCRWSNNKKMWYWHHAEDGSRYHRGKRTIDEIRSKYGSQVFGADGSEYSGYQRIGATA